MGNSLLEAVWAEKLLLCERCLNSVLGPQSRPDPSSPAEHSELGEEQQLQFQLLLRRRIHWLVKIALLLASVPGLASGFPERASERGSSGSSPLPPSLPPSRQGLLEDTWLWQLRRRCPALAGLWEGPLCRRLPANPALAWSRGLPHLNQSVRETKNHLLQPEGLSGAFWAVGER